MLALMDRLAMPDAACAKRIGQYMVDVLAGIVAQDPRLAFQTPQT
ncbi:hypothetical protein [Loktanella sp. 5RATIMAR09]|nr:hypothetical protein [Loktanella sp. 5RATIMAR09]